MYKEKKKSIGNMKRVVILGAPSEICKEGESQELKKRKEQSQANKGTEELNHQQLNLSNQLKTT